MAGCGIACGAILAMSIALFSWRGHGERRSASFRLKSGLLVADWIKATFGIRPTLKWPNDVLFAGKNLAAILCETSSHGEIPEAVTVGVGLKPSPAARSLPEKISLLPMADVVSGTWDAPAVAAELARYIARRWTDVEREGVARRYGEYDVGAGAAMGG